MTKMSRQKFKYLENKNSFSDEITSIFHYFQRAFIEANKKTFFFVGGESSRIKYLCEKIDESLTWQNHVNNFLVKLNRENVLLLKIREFVDDKVARSIHFDIFESN